MNNKKPAETALLKKELQLKLELIREKEAALPDMIADLVPTAPYRDRVRDFIRVLESYIAGMDEQFYRDENETFEKQEATNPCEELAPNTNAYLICLIENTYGVSIAGDFSFDQLQFILNAMETVGDQITACVSELGISVSDAFRAVFGEVPFVYDESERSSITRTIYDEQGNPITTITIDDSAFYNSEGTAYPNSTIPERIIRHELGHAFLNAFGEIDPKDFDGLVSVTWFINGNRYEIPLPQSEYGPFTERLLFDYLRAFTGWTWNPDLAVANGYYLGTFEVSVTINGVTRNVDLSEYYFNAINNPHPREDFADTFAVFTAPPNDEFERQALFNSLRVEFFRENFCCLVRQRLGVNSQCPE